MSKINEIQQRLGELNGGEFQKIMDAYFSNAYKGTLYPIGSVLENNNTKTGTPDSLLKPDEEKYIYIEYTVQKQNIIAKFKDDIVKCLDENKTGIQRNQIGRIICCCNTRLGTGDIEELVSTGRDNEIIVEVISLDSIAYRLIHEPLIIKDFLGISIDTQQILEIQDFINFNDSAKLATPLDVELIGRNEKVIELVDSLEEKQIVVISGLPGVGKTRLALEVLRTFQVRKKHYITKCLRNNGQNIYDDLNVYFNRPGSYLIMIDDANLLTNLHLILDLFSKKARGIEIKLIVTIREYAEQKLTDLISKYEYGLFKVDPLSEKDIKLLCNLFEINNYKYIKRIYEISKGNPRLAIMASTIAKKENTLSSLENVIDIIESYYREIKFNFEAELQNKNLIKVGALISFLDYISLKDEENIDKMCRIVGVTKTEMFDIVKKLHVMEVVDIHESEIVKVSDQILSIYIFYQAIFKENFLSYKDLLDNYYPELKGRIVENLNNVFSYFYKEDYMSMIKAVIKNKYDENLKNYTEEEIEEYLKTFWFALDTQSLIYVQEKIVGMEQGVVTDFNIKNNENDYPNTLIILSQFKQSKYYKEAIELILEYLEKEPKDFSKIYNLLIDKFGIDNHSLDYAYEQEMKLFLIVEKKYKIYKNDLYLNQFHISEPLRL